MTQPPDQQHVPYYTPEATKTSGLAIASMVVGILAVALCFVPLVPGLVALILGIVAITKTGPGQMRGRGFAVAGVATGGTALLLSLLVLPSILLPSLNRARGAANKVKCASNMRQIGQAMRQYAIDDVREGRYPTDLATLLNEPSTTLTNAICICPSSNDAEAPAGTTPTAGGTLSYVYLAGGMTDSMPATAVLLYEPVNNHSRDGSNFLFGDGSVRFLPRAQARAMISQLQQGINPPDPNAAPPAEAGGE